MFSQIINFNVKDEDAAKLREAVDNWVVGPGKRLQGCEQIIVSHENTPGGRGSVVVTFNNQEALDRFSSDSESLQFFENVKPLFEENLEYYEASIQKHDLS